MVVELSVKTIQDYHSAWWAFMARAGPGFCRHAPARPATSTGRRALYDLAMATQVTPANKFPTLIRTSNFSVGRLVSEQCR